ncbi:MAG: penicillin-binding protein 1A [Caulobacteraceae bacterium]|nr:penicillin-binding protein 1A [Caulobacteraceae bacterium]
MAGVVILSMVAVAGFAVAIYAAWLFHDLPDAGELAEYRPPVATRVFGWDGTLIGEFSTERRIFVPYDEIPPVVAQAFLAAEDRNFFHHGGIDVGGLGRAMAKNVLNFVRGRRLEGGSTITQQVAKNIMLTNQATVGRKLKEAILARRLEATLDKRQILELYLNEIFLGYRSYGVASAAFNYFGKPLDRLTLAEAAYLAALPKGPSNYHPIKNKQRALERRNWILGQMAEAGSITRAQAEAAMREDLVVQLAPQRARYRDADFFVEEVRRRAIGLFGHRRVTEGGYYLRTTLDSRMQTAARIALMDGLEAYDRRHGWRGAWGNVVIQPGWEKEAAKKAKPAERRTWVAAAVLTPGGAIQLAQGGAGQLVGEDVSWANAGKGLKRGDLIFVEPAANGGGYRLRQIPAVNGALVALDPNTGRVMAMVGGYSFSLSNFNRATQANRQPGSTFKPFVYATALEDKFTPASIILDAPIRFGNWSPENYSHRYYGPSRIRTGLELSRNVMTVRLAQQVGMNRIAENAIRYGIVKHMEPQLAMALGAGETTPFKLTAAYSIFPNGGRRVTPHLIELVEDRTGDVIYRADSRRCLTCGRGFAGAESPRLRPDGEQVLDPVVAYEITSMLEGVVQRGTGTAARVLNRPVAGKTGTTNEYRSAWFVGFTPDLVVGVFVGFDDNRSLGSGEAGAVTAVPIFVNFMQQAVGRQAPKPFRKPKQAKYVMVGGIEEAFRPGTEPRGPIGPARPSSSSAGAAVQGPRPYNEVWRDGRVSGAANAADASRGPPPPAN